MSGDRWTLLLLRSKDSPVRQYSFSPRTVHYAVGGALALALTFSGLAVAVGLEGTARLEAGRLHDENELLSAELSRIQGRMAELETTLDGLSDDGAHLRVLAGLGGLEDEVLEVGVGGPGLETPESHPLYEMDEALGKTAFAVTYDLNVLSRRARLLSESMAEATDSLIAHRDLLESTPSILPTPGFLSSRFSRSRYHPIHQRALPHEGIDIAAPRGTPIQAAAKGRVVEAGWQAGYGQMIEIDHGYGFTTRYGHASKLLVRVGQEVERGAVIAQVGSTGIATSPHVHYEVRVGGRPQNPMNYVLPSSVF